MSLLKHVFFVILYSYNYSIDEIIFFNDLNKILLDEKKVLWKTVNAH